MKHNLLRQNVTSLRPLPTLRSRLILMMGALLLLYSLVLTLSFTVTSQVRVSNPPRILVQGQGTSADYVEIAQEATLSDIRTHAFLSLGLLTLFGSVGAYWLSGQALRPLRRVMDTAEAINAGSLDVRLDMEGPVEVRALAQALNAMLARLEAAFTQQGRFVADAAHELRTPLATLRTTLETLPPAAIADDYREVQAACGRVLGRMEGLVENLLLLATDEALAAEAVVLGPLLEDVLADFARLADEHRVTLRSAGDAGLAVEGDEALLRLVFANLVENGIRYNRPGGQVSVHIGRAGEQVMVRVQDDGIGIPAAEQSHIFDRFYRFDRSRSRHTGGAGLGLSVARHIVQRHEGAITLASSSGEGSTFTVQLPAYSVAT